MLLRLKLQLKAHGSFAGPAVTEGDRNQYVDNLVFGSLSVSTRVWDE